MLSISLPMLIIRHIRKDGHPVNSTKWPSVYGAYFLMYLWDYLDNEVHRREHAEISGSIRRSHFSAESERRISHIFIRVTLHYLNLYCLKQRDKGKAFSRHGKIFTQNFCVSQLFFVLLHQNWGVFGASISHQHPKMKPLLSQKRCRGSSYN